MDTDPKKIERERRRLTLDLPPIEEVLRASLFERAVRCGKANCHCADPDDPGHRTTYVSLALPDGKTSQVSLPRELVPVAGAWIDNYRRWLEAVERISALNHELLRGRWVEPPPQRSERRRRR
jgi:hypothetical protein